MASDDFYTGSVEPANKHSVTVYRDADSPGSYTWSPFVAKLETRLRFSRKSYSVQAGSLSASPKGKVPYVRIEDEKGDSKIISDSTLITRTLMELGEIEDLNSRLSPREKAMDLAIRSLLEDKIYFLGAPERWNENYYIMRDIGPLSPIPWPIRYFVGLIVYRKVTTMLHGQGTGRYTPAEVTALREEGWESLESILAAKPGQLWVLDGEGPTEADASLYGFLVSAMTCKANPKNKEFIRGLPCLMGFLERIHEVYFPDYRKWE